MTIETKFNINDVVYFRVDNNIESGTISNFGINSTIDINVVDIKYVMSYFSSNDGRRNLACLKESELFSSKQELINENL